MQENYLNMITKPQKQHHQQPYAPNTHYDKYDSIRHQDAYDTGIDIEGLGPRNINSNNRADFVQSQEELLNRFKTQHTKPSKDTAKVNKKTNQQVEESPYPEESTHTAIERLSEFPLQKLKLTMKGDFDKRNPFSKDYVYLCESANVEPKKYYLENFIDKNFGNQHSANNEEAFKATLGSYSTNPNNVSDHDDEEEKDFEVIEDNQRGEVSSNEAGIKLRDFPLGNLSVTKKGGFDQRKKDTKDYEALCEAAGVDPLQYYLDNFIDADRNIEQTLNKAKPSPKETSQASNNHSKETIREVKKNAVEPNEKLVYAKAGHLDMRHNVNKEYIAGKIREAEEEKARFDVSQLKYTKSNVLDKRYKVNKEYLEICERCKESYYANQTN